MLTLLITVVAVILALAWGWERERRLMAELDAQVLNEALKETTRRLAEIRQGLRGED